MKKNVEEEEIVKEDNTFSLPEVLTVMVICIALGLFIGGFVVNNRNYNTEEVGPKIDFNEMTGLYDDIKTNYYGEYTEASMRDNTILGLLSSLKDPYAKLITGDSAIIYREDLESEYVGIGVILEETEDYEYPRVKEIIKLSPASKSDIKIGDYIIKVGDKDIKDLSIERIYLLTKGGTRGDKIKITTRRIENEEAKDKNLTISKEIVSTPSISVNYIDKEDKKIAEIVIKAFSKNTYAEFKKAYDDIKKEKCAGLIIDVRDNGGGLISSASNITSMFLDKNKVIYISKKNEKTEKIYSKDDKIIDIPTVLIVNERTASGSEVLVTALKENLDVKIVGKTTYGKNTLQKLHKLNDGALVKFTIGEWLTSKGNNLSENKIIPDIIVDNDIDVVNNSENDRQLIEAIKLF